MRRTLLALGMALAGIAPASATETVSCSAADGSDALVEMNVGAGLSTMIPNWVRVGVADKTWSTLSLDTEAIPLVIRQAFDNRDQLLIDLAGDADILISIRILRAEEGENTLRVGYLHVLGQSIHPVICDFGENE